MTLYYTLSIQREPNGPWEVEFRDFDFNVVADEADDLALGEPGGVYAWRITCAPAGEKL